jgi:2,4-dienoyl-CoA reductase-like NADH-dependent reductase (Old Yellow Enzyme family)
MAELMAPKQNPDDKFPRAYSEWADGGWGFIFTGQPFVSNLARQHLGFYSILKSSPSIGNVQVFQMYLGSLQDVAIPVPTENTPELQKTWRNWATAIQSGGTPALLQLCHPGRQSPPGAGKRSFLTKNLAPSAVALNMGSSFIARIATCVMFGTPR